MARDRLNNPDGEIGSSTSSPMKPGDVRTIVDPKSGKVITLHRTERPYVEDLCDAYNEAMSVEAKRRGLGWHVDDGGQLKLADKASFSARQTKSLARKEEYDRQQWKRNNREGEFTDPHAAREIMDF